MIKNYATNFFFLVLAFSFQLNPIFAFTQEPKIFKVSDFDLMGRVKSCLVITDYGKEEFEFNEAGLLTKSVTRFNENDFDVTYYKYAGSELSERRNENYRDGVFDKSTSIAHLYSIDTTANKRITEKIVSYNNEFLDQYEYQYDEEGRLVKILRSNNEGLDETKIENSTYKGELTKSILLNGMLQKSVRTSFKKKRNGIEEKIVLTKEFLEGTPTKAVEAVFDKDDKLIREQNFLYNSSKKSFSPTEFLNYEYDDKGMLTAVKSRSGNLETLKEYIYQFDREEGGNWIKQIITPENLYTTRRITYFEALEAEVEEE